MLMQMDKNVNIKYKNANKTTRKPKTKNTVY